MQHGCVVKSGIAAAKDSQAFVEEYDGSGWKIIAEWIRELPISPEKPEAYEALQELLTPKGN